MAIVGKDLIGQDANGDAYTPVAGSRILKVGEDLLDPSGTLEAILPSLTQIGLVADGIVQVVTVGDNIDDVITTATYITNGYAWGERALDLAGTCAFYIGLYEESRELTREAWGKAPNDQRIIANLKFVCRNGPDPIDPVFWLLEECPGISSEFDVKVGSIDNSSSNYIVGSSPGDIIIFFDDNFKGVEFCQGWDRWLFNKFGNYHGCIVVTVDNIKVLTAFDYGCFIRSKSDIPDDLIKCVESDLFKVTIQK